MSTPACMLWVAPLERMVCSSGFGPRPRIDPRTGRPGPLHPGWDLCADPRAAVRAVADGVVLRSYLSGNFRLVVPLDAEGRPVVGAKPQLVPYAWKPGLPDPDSKGYGETILLLHADGTQTRYAHLDSRLVQEGEHVAAGQAIGLAGSTGFSFGCHLHFEAKADGGRSFLDPAPLFAHLAVTRL